MPWPPPMQAEPRPWRAPRRRSSYTRCIAMRAPLAASGCPSAIAPPSTLVRSRGKSSSFRTAMTWGENASFTSKRSNSESFAPARARALRIAGTGPMPMIVGSTPAWPQFTMRASGRSPRRSAYSRAARTSGICDGAGARVIAAREYAARGGLRPLARIVNWGHAGVDPTIMGIGPVPAIRNALARAGAKLSEFDLFEVNEAFSPQVIAVLKELDLPRERTNVDGGAIALGHPLAASGARIAMHLVYELRRRGARHGLGSACIGGGQGIALVLEAL